ncbi:MAG: hypothetical protein WC156_14635 [Pedobacter sp.]
MLPNEAVRNLPLNTLLNQLISNHDHIRTDQVTIEYIRQQREAHVYPSTVFDIGSDYGGYDVTGLLFKTRDGFEKMEADVDQFLDNCLRK